MSTQRETAGSIPEKFVPGSDRSVNDGVVSIKKVRRRLSRPLQSVPSVPGVHAGCSVGFSIDPLAALAHCETDNNELQLSTPRNASLGMRIGSLVPRSLSDSRPDSALLRGRS